MGRASLNVGDTSQTLEPQTEQGQIRISLLPVGALHPTALAATPAPSRSDCVLWNYSPKETLCIAHLRDTHVTPSTCLPHLRSEADLGAFGCCTLLVHFPCTSG